MSAALKAPLLRMRPMLDTDVSAVMAVEEAAYPHPWTSGIFQDCLRVGYCCWVAELDETIVTYGVSSVVAGECHVLNVCVHPQWQGRGFGRKMLNRMLGIARQHHADTAFLEVRVSNRAAIELYLSEGFNEIGLRRNYYPNGEGREDALLFAKTL